MSKKILIIDDDPDILDSVQAILEGNGFSVVRASSGNEGIKAFKNESPDLVLCDMMMESVDSGSKVTEELKNQNPSVPVYLLSSIGDATAMNVELGKLGFNGAFQKPIDPDNLVNQIKKALNM